MQKEIHLYRVSDGRLIEVPQNRLDLESRLEEWIAHDVALLGIHLLVIGRQVATEYGGYIDLLCVDASGDLVVVELKRDRTPREITAQVLDYASWVTDLTAEQVTEMADAYLRPRGTLETVFREVFDEDLPDVINNSHKLLIVGSDIDSGSERIIRYLSDQHGVSINALTFQYFRTPSGEELIGRVHLLEPAVVESRVRTKGASKRRPRLSAEELEAVAEQAGAGELYRHAFETFEPLFKYARSTRSSMRFTADLQDGKRAILNLIATDATTGRLPFQIYTHRAHVLFAKSESDIVASLPAGTEAWEYYSGADEWWRGHKGHFESKSEVDRLRTLLVSQ